MDTFEIIGYPVAITSDKLKGFESITSDSGWNTRVCRFNIKSGTNTILVQIKGGVFIENKKIKPGQKIYSFSKGDANGKGEKLEIPFAERKKAEWIERVAAFKKMYIDRVTPDGRKMITAINKALENGDNLTDEQFKFLGVSSIDEVETAISEKSKEEYLSEWDFADAVNKAIPELSSKKVKVSGNVEISYDMKTGNAYKNYVVNRIQVMPDDAETKAIVSMDIFFNKDSIDLSNWTEEKVDGEKIPNLSGSAVVNFKEGFYYNDKRYGIKGNFYTDSAFEIPAKKSNYGIKNMFSKEFDEDVKWKMVRLNLNIIDGAETVELTEDMLTEDQLIDIECGAYTLEDLKRDMGGNIYGERVRKYTFRELTNKTKRDESTAFEDSDMMPPHAEDNALDDDDEDIFE